MSKEASGRVLQKLEHSIIAELEEAVKSGSSERRVETLRQVTNLFLHDGDRLSEDQIKVFDDVLCVLISRVESRARAELSQRLAPIDYAPFEVIQHLARDNEIAVAGSVLANSSRLRTSDLVEIASTRGQDHLLAISGRTNLPEAVTDVIVDRGERKVIRKLANNASARFSDTGYSTIVARAEADDELTEILGLRIDLPIKFLRDLLRRATDAVRARLMAIAPPELQEEIKRILKTIAGAAGEDGLAAAGFQPRRSAGEAVETAQRARRRRHHQVCRRRKARGSRRLARRSQQCHHRHDGAASGGTPVRPHPDPLQIRRPELADGGNHPFPPSAAARRSRNKR